MGQFSYFIIRRSVGPGWAAAVYAPGAICGKIADCRHFGLATVSTTPDHSVTRAGPQIMAGANGAVCRADDDEPLQKFVGALKQASIVLAFEPMCSCKPGAAQVVSAFAAGWPMC